MCLRYEGVECCRQVKDDSSVGSIDREGQKLVIRDSLQLDGRPTERQVRELM